METILKKIRANVLISALLCIALGIVLVVWPGMSVKIVCRAIGAVLVINGLIRLLNFVFRKDGSLFSQMNLILGVVIALIGIWIFSRPDTIIALVPILVGVIIVIHGINNLEQAVSLFQSKYDKWWVALVLGLITVGFGVLLIFRPFEAVDTLIMFIGLFLIYDGVSDIWIISRVSRTAKQLKQEMEAVDADAKEVDD